jgi:hypothetical protein
MAILTINHYINQANSFITDIRNNRNGYYIFAARSQPWANSSGGNDDASILTVNNSVAQVEQSIYNDMLYGKLLIDSDVINLIPRYDWVSNTVYDVYDQTDSNLYSKQFFVVTDKYEVYKCIDNNNGSASYVKPTLTTTSGLFKTGDGYLWKYMYTVDSASNTKFTTTNYIPVITNTAVQGNTTAGSIDVIKITNGGNGYFVYENGYIGGMANAYAVQLSANASGIDNYYTNSSIYLKSGFGAGQVRQISSSNGVSKRILVDEPFTLYTRLDLANIAGTIVTGYLATQPYNVISYLYPQGYFNINAPVAQSDTGITGTIVATNSSVIQVTKYLDQIKFSNNYPIVDTTQSGSLKTGTVSVGNTGACNLAIITINGSGYTANATVTISNNGSTGTGGTANAQANSTGKITAINISNVGSGYFVSPTITISAPTAQTFNANSAVTGGTGGGSNSTIALATANSFVINDLITYVRSTGNVANIGLSSGSSYYIQFANSTVVALKSSITGSRITLTKSANNEVGHTLQGQTATAIMYCDNQLVYGSGTQLNDSANGYSNNEYIRVGANTTSNIRRVINTVNTTVVVVDIPFKNTFTSTGVLNTISLSGATALGYNNTDIITIKSPIVGSTNANVTFTTNATGGSLTFTIANTGSGFVLGNVPVSNIAITNSTGGTATGNSTVTYLIANVSSANSHYKMPVVAEPSSVLDYNITGYISNTNLNSVKIALTNSSLTSTFFTIGEKVNMTDSSLVNQGANGIVAYANSTTAILSNVLGTWSANNGGNTQFYVSGQSSLQLSQIVLIETNPNVTINNPSPNGDFKLGYPVFFKDSFGFTGNAVVTSKITLPNDQTEYQIGPTIKITGDGSNAAAIAIVNTATNSVYDIIGVDIINPGSGYTQANIAIYSNTGIGLVGGATARAIISPVYGHGYDAVSELGGRYVGIDAKFDITSNENYEFLPYGSYRKVGILQNPQFKDIRVTLTNFDRANFTLNTSSYSTTLGWTPGEVVLQSTTNAAGVVVYGNSSFLQLKNVKGIFNISNTIHGYYSNSTSNVITANTIYFPVGNTAEIVTESNSGSVGIITSIVSNTVYFMSNVVGQFANGDIMYDSVVNAYATVASIYTANGTKDSSANFGNRFNQTARITLTANTGAFIDNEYVQQDTSLATGRVISSSYEKDLVVSSMNPANSFAIGQTITDTTTNANGICTFANSTYLKLTAISQSLSFGNTHTINNGSGSTATINNVYPVLILNDVSDVSNFQANTYNAIIGNSSSASAICNNYLLITNPDLVRDSGKLIYSESFAPVTRSSTTKEEFKLVLKF